MRTTVEIPDGLRARLVQISAERGEKGFSRLIQEAIELYLSVNQARREKIEAARAVLGSLDDESAEALRESSRRLRETWR